MVTHTQAPLQVPPPAPHDPALRASMHEHLGWDIRAHPRNDPGHAYLATRGMLHMQLWHKRAQISILTPSKLTRSSYHLWSPTRHVQVCCYTQLSELLRDDLHLNAPCERLVRHFEALLVWAPALTNIKTCLKT